MRGTLPRSEFMSAASRMISSCVVRPGSSPLMRPCRITRMRSATCSNSCISELTISTAAPDARQFVHHFENLHLRADVDAARRLVEQEHARAAEQPLGDHHFLLIAAAQPSRQLAAGTATRMRRRAMYSAVTAACACRSINPGG